MSAFPPWSWVPCPKQPWGASASHDVEGYLSLENIILSCYAQEEHDEISCPQKEETSCSEKEELIDIATLVQSNCSKVPYYDLHIIYSASYRVPVLFFRAYYSDGEPLGFNAIEKDLPAHSAKALLDSKWTFITQEEHPYLNRPWFKLHPCGTSEWMKLLFHVDVSVAKNGVTIELYLLSWLSVVGQVVGLRIPLEMLNQP
ncbi:ubiquitin-like-conjugating enzyme ATG10 isoform X5 [Corylus avellana]|nr:ubiquitin-like-conjugating enzyme ATG10 isoform X5 [Corylus avellana]